MPGVRRPACEAQTRIPLVLLAWLQQGVSGNMTHIAPSSCLSRTFLSQRLWVATRHVAGLFREEPCLLQHDQHPGQPRIVLWRREGQGALARMAAIGTTLPYHPHAVGALRPCLHHVGSALPSPGWMASQHVVLSRSDAMCAIDTPL